MSKFKIGDKVLVIEYSCKYRWPHIPGSIGTITNITDSMYPIKVKFENKIFSHYQGEGNYREAFAEDQLILCNKSAKILYGKPNQKGLNNN